MRNRRQAKDWIVKHQIAAEAWYVANPNLTAAETRRLERVGKAVEEFLGQAIPDTVMTRHVIRQ